MPFYLYSTLLPLLICIYLHRILLHICHIGIYPREAKTIGSLSPSKLQENFKCISCPSLSSHFRFSHFWSIELYQIPTTYCKSDYVCKSDSVIYSVLRGFTSGDVIIRSVKELTELPWSNWHSIRERFANNGYNYIHKSAYPFPDRV